MQANGGKTDLIDKWPDEAGSGSWENLSRCYGWSSWNETAEAEIFVKISASAKVVRSDLTQQQQVSLRDCP